MATPLDHLTVAVVDDDPRVRTRVAMQLGDVAEAQPFPTLDALEEKVYPGTPMVLLVGPSYADDDGLVRVEQLTRMRPEAGTILLVEELSTELLQRALRSGVKDVLTSGSESETVVETVRRVADSLAVVPRSIQPLVDTGAGERPDGSRLVTVFSTKGGSGKSVVATNLAVALSRLSERPVALVDADLQFGDIAVLLKLTPQHTIVDAVNAMERLDAQLLQSLLVRHEPSGVLVLPAPLEPAFADQVSSADMSVIVKLLQSFCSHVVVDTPAYFNDVVLGLLEESDDILLIAGMDIPHIKNVKIGLQTLRLLNVPQNKLHLVLNRANAKVKLDVGEIEKTLQLKAETLVPSDVLVPQTVNKGVPAVIDAPKSAVARSLERLAEQFVTESDRARSR